MDLASGTQLYGPDYRGFMGYDGIQMLGFHGYMVCEINDKSMTFSAIKISLHIVAITYNWLLLAPFGSSFVHIVCFLAQLGQEDLRAMEKERHMRIPLQQGGTLQCFA